MASFALGALRLVDDHDRVRVLNVAHRRFAVEPVLRLIDNVFRLFERVDIDDHDLDIGVHGELANIVGPGRTVYKKSVGHVFVLLREIVAGHFQRLVDTLADRHRGHHDDELREPVSAVQLEDRLRIDKSFARAGLHLDAILTALQIVREW